MFLQTCFTVLVIVVTYAFIGAKVVSSRRTVTRTNSAGSNKKTLLVSICIIATYIVFYVIPCPIVVYNLKVKNGDVGRRHVIAEALQCFSLVGSIVDVLVYVLLTNSNREFVCRLCCPCRKRESREDVLE